MAAARVPVIVWQGRSHVRGGGGACTPSLRSDPREMPKFEIFPLALGGRGGWSSSQPSEMLTSEMSTPSPPPPPPPPFGPVVATPMCDPNSIYMYVTTSNSSRDTHAAVSGGKLKLFYLKPLVTLRGKVPQKVPYGAEEIKWRSSHYTATQYQNIVCGLSLNCFAVFFCLNPQQVAFKSSPLPPQLRFHDTRTMEME